MAYEVNSLSLGRSIAATEDCEFGCLRLVNEGSLTTSLDGNVEFPPIDPKYTD